MKKINIKGFSIIEMLVVVSVFAVIGVIVTSIVSITLKGSKKSDSIIRVRENVNYSLAVIERQIRNAESITPCAGDTLSSLTYTSIDGITSTFSFDAQGYVASGSARLTSNDILVTACTFTCTKEDENSPSSVKISITAKDNSTAPSAQKAEVTSDIEIITRNY